MSEHIVHRPALTQAVLNIPYQLDGRPWNAILGDTEPPVLTGQRGRNVHLEVSKLLEGIGVTDAETPLDAATQLREQLFAEKTLALRGLGRGLMQMHNNARVTLNGYIREEVQVSGLFNSVHAGELAETREDPENALIHLRMAGYFGTGSLPYSAMAVRSIFADAVEYLDRYPPALPQGKDEYVIPQLALAKGVSLHAMKQVVAAMRPTTRPVVRRAPGSPAKEVECYRLEDFVHMPAGPYHQASATLRPVRRNGNSGARKAPLSVKEVIPARQGMSAKELVDALKVQERYVDTLLSEIGYSGDRADIPFGVVSQVGQAYLAEKREYKPDYSCNLLQIAAIVGARPRVVRTFLVERGHMGQGELVEDVRFAGEQIDTILQEFQKASAPEQKPV